MSHRTRSWWLSAVVGLVTAAPSTALAQAATITGKVTAENGTPLFGSAVSIEALTLQVGTNEQGQYTIIIPAARVSGQTVILRARAIGYTPDTKSITLRAGAQTFDFVLKEDINRLSQVVVTGVTGATEQRKLPFTVTQVTDKDLPVPSGNVLQSIQGKIPGAQMVISSGRPGSNPEIILRAPQSISTGGGRSLEPLFIVDGVIQQGNLRDIDPQDIENVEVIKGAAASTLYGSRAGNGVIAITTKSGKNSAEGVRFSTRVESGLSDIPGSYKWALTHFLLMDEAHSRFCEARGSVYLAQAATQDCLRTINFDEEARRVNEESGSILPSPVKFLMDGGIALSPHPINLRGMFQVNNWPVIYDPVAQLVTHGPFTNTTIDMTGKFGRANFFASLGDNRERGSVVFLDGFHRNNIRLNVDEQFGTNWTASVRTYYARSNRFTGGTDFFSITRQPPFVDLLRRDKFGRLYLRSTITDQGNQNVNPAYSWEQANSRSEVSRFVGSAALRWQPFSWLSGSYDFGYDISNSQSRGQTNVGYRITTNSSPSVPLGSGSRSGGYSQSYNMITSWSARRQLLSDLATRFTVQATYEQQDSNSDSQSGSQFAAPGLTTTDALIANFSIGSGSSSQRSVGVISSVNLDYRDRYILDLSMRRDGLSVFGTAHRWQSYGRGSFAWRVSEEPWYPFARSVDELKLRYSIGQAGNRPGNNQQYETFTIGTGGVLNPSTLGNKNLAPEVATEVEVGLDAQILEKYGLNISYSHNITSDQILQVTPPAASGFSSQWKNAGTLDGKTYEISLNLPLVERRDLQWSAKVSWDRVHSKITSYDLPCFPGSTNRCAGEDLGGIYGREFVKYCVELPAAFRDRCGEGKEWQRNDEGFIVWVGPGLTWRDGIRTNAWQAVLPAALSPWGKQESWGMPITIRDDSATGATKPIKVGKHGNALPDFRWSLSQNFQFKKLSGYVLVDAVRGKWLYNQERQWSLGDFAYQTNSQHGKTVETAKPIGYYWRAGPPDATGVGGLYDVLNSNNYSTENASFAKIREASVGYRLGRIGGWGDWSLSVIARNVYTWTRYTGFDPDVGTSVISGAETSSVFPPLRNYTFTLRTSF